MIKEQEAIHLENIAHQALDSQARDFGAAGCEPLSRPDQDVVRQGFQLDQDLLGIRGLTVVGDVAEFIHQNQPGQFSAPLAVLDSTPAGDPAC